MIVKYGMGKNNIYPYYSDKSKEIIDKEISELLNEAANTSKNLIEKSKNLIEELSEILIKEKVLKREKIEMKIYRKYRYLLE